MVYGTNNRVYTGSMEVFNDPRKKLRVGIFFGGKSAEHEVSLRSAKNILDALDSHLFEATLIGIDKTGGWHIQQASQLGDGPGLALSTGNSSGSLTLLPGRGELIDTNTHKVMPAIDVAFPILHGPLGEDGTIQGFLELANIPYVGPDVLGSAVGMDKDVMKRLLRDANIPIAPFTVIHSSERQAVVPSELLNELGETVFVKPANMGSSVGVRRARSAKELVEAIDLAFEYDTKVIVESAIIGDEIECALLGNQDPETSVVGRIIPRGNDFYSYEAKYIDEKGAVLEIPANIPDDIRESARQLAIKTFRVLDCEGMGRVDMFVTKTGGIVVNEINTIPGFTKISMYPKLWEASGVPYSELITKLLYLAVERHERKSRLKTAGH